jgi:hypothetical protein
MAIFVQFDLTRGGQTWFNARTIAVRSSIGEHAHDHHQNPNGGRLAELN